MSRDAALKSEPVTASMLPTTGIAGPRDAVLRQFAETLNTAPAVQRLAAPLRPPRPLAIGPAPPVQRVINKIPDGEFRGNLEWAAWFRAMTREEVRQEATKLGLARAALENMNQILSRQNGGLIDIPDDYAEPMAIDSGSKAKSVPSSSSVGKLVDPELGSQSPFRIGAEPKPIDVSGKVSRALKSNRRLVKSPIKFAIMIKQKNGEYAQQDRPKDLKHLPKEDFDPCYQNANQAFLTKNKRNLAITVAPGRHVVFTTINAELLGEELSAIHAIRYEEPEPRSGLARAAADDQANTIRGKRDEEAPYAGPGESVGESGDYEDYAEQTGGSQFSSKISSGVIANSVVHTGPWAKGQRVPSQMGVMGGQNAKNYFLDQYMYKGEPVALSQKEKQSDLDDIGGRFEWLHIIGSSLGGPNVIGNLVCGTYDANTEMIALEHRVALWGKKDYAGTFKPTPQTPVKIEGDAYLYRNSFVGKLIVLRVFHGDKLVLERSYQALRPDVITKAQYKLAQASIETDIEKVKGSKDDIDPKDIDSGETKMRD